MPPSEQKITVDLAARSYNIHIGPGLLKQLGKIIKPVLASQKIAVITDENVFSYHGETAKSALSDYDVTFIVRPAGEAQKSFDVLQYILDQLFEAGLDRSDTVLALGGGVIGDLAGFAASIYKRGCGFIQVPTTLLAQVDSSVGGKTAINNRFGKNLIGAFYQPQMVIADTDVLSTLPAREIKAGYAEIVKYGLLGDLDFFEDLDRELGARVLSLDNAALTQAIARSCSAKARIVAADECETGMRALLNLGHTFAHALELAAGYDGDLLHGEAVSAGMDMAFQYSASAGLCSRSDAMRVRDHLSTLAMPLITDMDHFLQYPDQLVSHMRQDKKNEAGQITLILARAIGDSFVQKNTSSDDILTFLTSLKNSGVKPQILES